MHKRAKWVPPSSPHPHPDTCWGGKHLDLRVWGRDLVRAELVISPETWSKTSYLPLYKLHRAGLHLGSGRKHDALLWTDRRWEYLLFSLCWCHHQRQNTGISLHTGTLCRVPELPPLCHTRAEGVPKSRYFIAVFTAASLPSLQLLSDICALQSHWYRPLAAAFHYSICNLNSLTGRSNQAVHLRLQEVILKSRKSPMPRALHKFHFDSNRDRGGKRKRERGRKEGERCSCRGERSRDSGEQPQGSFPLISVWSLHFCLPKTYS